ncbi:MAG: hypothetical protein HWE15_11000 [Algoriphagus sp.]|nr:hypothetical protein [Algoriphagus sp.]
MIGWKILRLYLFQFVLARGADAKAGHALAMCVEAFLRRRLLATFGLQK